MRKCSVLAACTRERDRWQGPNVESMLNCMSMCLWHWMACAVMSIVPELRSIIIDGYAAMRLFDIPPSTVLLFQFCCAGAGSLADSTICPLPSRMATGGCWVVCAECCTWSNSSLFQVVTRPQVIIGFKKFLGCRKFQYMGRTCAVKQMNRFAILHMRPRPTCGQCMHLVLMNHLKVGFL